MQQGWSRFGACYYTDPVKSIADPVEKNVRMGHGHRFDPFVMLLAAKRVGQIEGIERLGVSS